MAGENRKKSNYDITRDATEARFLEYDQGKIIEKFHLQHDDEYLYLLFAGRDYRISRRTGRTEYRLPDTGAYVHGGFNEVLTIFDVLCGSRPDCCLSGKFVSLNAVKGLVVAAAPGAEFFAKEAGTFAGKCELLREACRKLGGVPEKVGDVSYRIPLFDFMDVILQFWDADEEFDAVVKILWDENILDYMRYETTFYASLHLLERLQELCGLRQDAAARGRIR